MRSMVEGSGLVILAALATPPPRATRAVPLPVPGRIYFASSSAFASAYSVIRAAT
jgi:hypothetical protein